MIRRYPLRIGLACVALLVCMVIIMCRSSQTKQPVIQTLDLPSAVLSTPVSGPLPLVNATVPIANPAPAALPPTISQQVKPTTPLSVVAAPVVAVTAHDEQWKTITIRSRDNPPRLFKRLGLNEKQLHDVLAFAKKTHILNQLKAGQTLRVLIDVPQRQLKQLDYPLNILDVLTIKQGARGFTSSVIHRQPVITVKYAANTVRHSLGAAVTKAGLPSHLVGQLSSIFASDAGFLKNIRPGDKFCLLYEAFYLDGKKIGTGNILEAEITTQGKVYRALRYTNPKGITNYYTPQGLSLQRAFTRTPVRYSHISSLFSFNRNHPLLHLMRAHQGVDYAAPRGTPIKATGDGRVMFIGYKGGYGNAIMLSHGGPYSTLYGHMQCFAQGLHRGSTVRQNQVIGYVGSTGLATGAHLHYEFLVNGVHRDPLTVPLPNSRPISPSYRAEFLNKARALMAKLAVYRQQS